MNPYYRNRLKFKERARLRSRVYINRKKKNNHSILLKVRRISIAYIYITRTYL